MKKITEMPLCNEINEIEALGFNLDEVANFIRCLKQEWDVSVHHEDYDDYGVKHYILIKGVCANLELVVDYGGMFSPTRGLVCKVVTKILQDHSSTFNYEHPGVMGGIAKSNNSSRFETREDVEDCEIYKNYQTEIIKWLDSASKYLEPNPDLFKKIDTISYADKKKGAHLWGNGITSYDELEVLREDFYTEECVNLKAKSKPYVCSSFNVDYFY